jgi:hypothetical protein
MQNEPRIWLAIGERQLALSDASCRLCCNCRLLPMLGVIGWLIGPGVARMLRS